jgi:hypothetical protein
MPAPRPRGREGLSRTRSTTILVVAAASSALLIVGLLFVASPTYAADAPVGLGSAGTYSVLGGSTVTNTGPTVLSGDLGVSPGTAITGFPPGTAGGATHAGDAPAALAQTDLVTAYDDAAGRAPTAGVSGDLVGQTLVAGVYNATSSLALSGTLTLDGQGNLDSVFIFQIGSTLTTATASNVAFINGAQACNVFWQIGSSATLGTGSTFRGTILALTSITVTTGTFVDGRALARNGAVTLDSNEFIVSACDVQPPTTTTTVAPPTTTTTTVALPTTTTTTVALPTTTTTVALPTTTTTVAPPTTTTTAPTTVTTSGAPTTSTTVSAVGVTTTTALTTTNDVTGSPPTDTGTSPPTLARTGAGPMLTLLLGLGALLIALGGALLAVIRIRRA